MSTVFISLLLTAMLASIVETKCPSDPADCLRPHPDPSKEDLLEEIKASLQQLAASSRGQQQVSSIGGHHHHHFSLNDTLGIECGENTTKVVTSTDTTVSGQESSSTTPKCKKCSKCPKNGILVRSCNATHDTLCTCPHGWFLSVLDYECKPCSDCPPGHGVWRTCNRYRDTKCRACPPGSYSGQSSGQMGCLLCTSCQPHQIMLQECSKIQNTVCVDKNIEKIIRLPGVTGRTRSSGDSNGSDDNDINESDGRNVGPGEVSSIHLMNPPSLHIYFSVLVVIICVVSFYVLLKWKLRSQLVKHNLVKQSPGAGNLYINKGPFRTISNVYSPLPQGGPGGSFRVVKLSPGSCSVGSSRAAATSSRGHHLVDRTYIPPPQHVPNPSNVLLNPPRVYHYRHYWPSSPPSSTGGTVCGGHDMDLGSATSNSQLGRTGGRRSRENQSHFV